MSIVYVEPQTWGAASSTDSVAFPAGGWAVAETVAIPSVVSAATSSAASETASDYDKSAIAESWAAASTVATPSVISPTTSGAAAATVANVPSASPAAVATTVVTAPAVAASATAVAVASSVAYPAVKSSGFVLTQSVAGVISITDMETGAQRFLVDPASGTDLLVTSLAITQRDISTTALRVMSAGPSYTANLALFQDSSGINQTIIDNSGRLFSLHPIGIRKLADTVDRARLDQDAGGTGKSGLLFGPGNAAQDVNLYRDAASVLKTDDDLHVAGAFTVDGNLGGNLGRRLYFMGN